MSTKGQHVWALPPNDSRSNTIAKKTVKEASGLLALFTTDTTLEIKDRPDFLPVQKGWRPAISLLDQFFLDILPALEGTRCGQLDGSPKYLLVFLSHRASGVR
jgi:hypothetical protein